MNPMLAKLRLLAVGAVLTMMLGGSLLLALTSVRAYDEENIEYFDPFDPEPLPSRTTYTPTVSSIHFDLVGALAIAAGFSVTDAAMIQIYSQATDSGPLPGANPVYTFDADPANFPAAPALTEVMTSTHCPAPSAINPSVHLGLPTDMMECPGCFTSRFGPYGIFFHMAHDSPTELGAIRAWAFAETEELPGIVHFGYSSTVESFWQGAANVYASTACFTSIDTIIDTGSIAAGSPQALGIYLHALGDHWSHQECITAADSQGLPFAAHVLPENPQDPLWPCRWTSHYTEFGNPALFPDSPRTFAGVLALYEALVAFSSGSDRALFRPIPVDAEGNYIYDTLQRFVYDNSNANPGARRRIADQLRQWALQTRASKPQYWLPGLYLPLLWRQG